MSRDVQVLADGIRFGESVRWYDGRVWFADWGTREVVAVGATGVREVVETADRFPISIDWLPDGRLLVLASELRAATSEGRLVAHGNLAAAPSGWNELVVHRRGSVYVNQVGFDMMGGAPPQSGTIARIDPDGTTTDVADDLWFPNGMAITPDDATLIVAESYRKRLSAFDIGSDGTLSGRRGWADLGDGVPDGLCMDAEGAVWYADVPNRCCVRVAEGGQVLDRVDVDRGCFSCALGGDDGRTLFIVATEWRGPEAMLSGDPTGVLLAVTVDVGAVSGRG
jgi:sugar lactone lactonase YvrE